jgi:putative heme-binding domain-containing protein
MKQIIFRAACILITFASLAFAQGTFVPETVSDAPPDPEKERLSFKVAEGFEVNLWAANPLLAKPIQMNWDAQGRLWVASSSTYPQIKPGEAPADKVLVLEDADNDGVAEKSTVFADDLLIPTAIAPGDGGAYVANSTELIHLKDTDNDGKADQRRVVLSGFGTEDTHHILHTFRWGNDGRLYMNQSIYTHSHVETPWGTKRLMAGGIWRFHPESVRFDVFARGWVNAWGHAIDRYGQSFCTDGAGGEGIYYAFPGSAFQTAKSWDGFADMERILKGMNPGSPKYCGIEIVTGRHLPDDWQGNVITNDFRANRVVRYQLTDENGTYVSKQMPDVITSTDVAFRPIDVKMGPDGAIYIADWYNPIIQHGEVDFRDKRRDKTHGRIWRITAKGRPLVKRPTLVGAPVTDVLSQLASPEEWTRHQAKLVLRSLGTSAVLPALGEYVTKLNLNHDQDHDQKLEALWIYQTLDTPEPALLAALLRAKKPQIRAAATRIVPDWADRLPNAMQLLTAQAGDEHPRVRLEAVRSLARIPSPDAIEIAMTVLDQPTDANVEYALWATANETKSTWMPAFLAGKLKFNGKPAHLAYALQAVKSPEALATLVKQLRAGQIPASSRADVFELIASVGSADDVTLLFEIATAEATDASTAASALVALEKSIRQRNVQPKTIDASQLAKWISGSDENLRVAAMRFAGAAKVAGVRDELKKAASSTETSDAVAQAAINALAELGSESADFLRQLDSNGHNWARAAMAVGGLSSIDRNDAAQRAAKLLAGAPADADPAALLTAFLQRENGGEALASALADKKISADLAKLALRYVNATGRDTPVLTQRFRDAAGIGEGSKPLTPEQLAETIREVQTKGDAGRGEIIFRSAAASCFQCHAVGGAGGQLGPDLRAIGAASPVDYLIDSIIEPNKAVKDGYQAVLVATKKGEVFSGIKVSQDDKQIVLRDAVTERIVIPVTSVRKERASGSLMPAGLGDTLTRGEFLDLIKFLSELGKPGTYGPDNALLVRRWRVLDEKGVESQPAYSMVSGVLPMDAVVRDKTQATVSVRGEIDVTSPGRVALVLGNPRGITLSVDGKPVEAADTIELELARGVHSLTFTIDVASRGNEGLRVELRDVPGSGGHAQPVSGR